MISITKTFEFCSSHKLYNPNWSEEKNFEVYGKCANENGHGHNYLLEVSVSGPIDPESGMIINAMDLSEIVKNGVYKEVDHKNLNLDVPWLEGKMPTVEVLTEEIWKQIEKSLKTAHPHVELSRIKLWETSKIFSEKVRFNA
jgi:6-pyruvoyltetrahydropterin/6-carboxytetrahydropterin synthase